MKDNGIRSFALLYTNQGELKQFIQKNCFSDSSHTSSEWLVCIHTCIHKRQEAAEIAKQIAVFLPNAHVIGTSAAAVIYNGTTSENSCLILFTQFNNTHVRIHTLSYHDSNADLLALATIEQVVKPNTKAIFTFFSGICPYVQEYFDVLAEKKMCVPMTGGLAGANANGAFAFCETGALEDCVVFAALDSNLLQPYNRVISGHEPLGNEYTITSVNGADILSVNHQPAIQWLRHTLGVEQYAAPGLSKEEATSIMLTRFPMMLSDAPCGVSRFLNYIGSQNRIEMPFSKIYPGQKFRIGFLSLTETAAELKSAIRDLESTPCQIIFSYSCIIRKTFLNHFAEWELQFFRNCSICGAFTHGEIGMKNGVNTLFSGSNSMLGLSESKTARLPIDLTPFSTLQSMHDEWKNVYQYVLKNQNKQMHQNSDQLNAQLLMQKKRARDTMFLDRKTGLENVAKFKYDTIQQQYDKLCMITIEKGNLISGFLGEKILTQLRCENIQHVKKVLNDDNLHLYVNDTWSFFFVASKFYSEQKFMQKSELVFKECSYYFCSQHNITAVNNFHIVINETNLLEKVQLCISTYADNNTRFHVYDSSNTEQAKQKMDEKLFMTNVISDAILYDRVVPYFQPIRDNRTGKFHRYEALMRLSDSNGKIYVPGQFLDIAKEYHLYLQLSQQMVRKVLEIFHDRKDGVFMNLSAYDIGSKTNRKFLYDLLKQLPPTVCKNITFEILESERLRDYEELKNFIKNVKRYGVKIAIDDFGAGYSNFMAIIQIQPDFIKIDGDIVINCHKEPVKQICLSAIADIARGIQAEVIAEHVETHEEQRILEKIGIQYTQGYYFAKPMHYSNLKTSNR